ncbi:hypothetical protein RRG08_000239 [Elysia crispata]|uniref:Uncharacterized protein n=1 Tax=Elysia crispata TaxID=231223 RepID=A0AAE1AY11_9GAST|nr:hypothetical protein RRG08_000239 [Elysia crispata]
MIEARCKAPSLGATFRGNLPLPPKGTELASFSSGYVLITSSFHVVSSKLALASTKDPLLRRPPGEGGFKFPPSRPSGETFLVKQGAKHLRRECFIGGTRQLCFDLRGSPGVLSKVKKHLPDAKRRADQGGDPLPGSVVNPSRTPEQLISLRGAKVSFPLHQRKETFAPLAKANPTREEAPSGVGSLVFTVVKRKAKPRKPRGLAQIKGRWRLRVSPWKRNAQAMPTFPLEGGFQGASPPSEDAKVASSPIFDISKTKVIEVNQSFDKMEGARLKVDPRAKTRALQTIPPSIPKVSGRE